jgi:hypothetical protein
VNINKAPEILIKSAVPWGMTKCTFGAVYIQNVRSGSNIWASSKYKTNKVTINMKQTLWPSG